MKTLHMKFMAPILIGLLTQFCTLDINADDEVGGSSLGRGMGRGMMNGDCTQWAKSTQGSMGYGMGMMGHSMGGMMNSPMASMMFHFGEGYASLLDLDEKQEQEIRKLYDVFWKQQWDLMQEMHNYRLAMPTVYAEESPDKESIMEGYRKLSDMHLKMMEYHLDLQLKVHKLLTKEQREKLEQTRRWGMDWE